MGEYVYTINSEPRFLVTDMSEIALRIEALTSKCHDESTQAPDQLASMVKKEVPRLPPAVRAN